MSPLFPAACLRFGLIGSFLALSPVTLAAPREQSVSTSRQFIVYGTDVGVRGAICDLAERAKQDLLVLLGQGDSWTTPIVIYAQYRQANLPEAARTALTVSQTGSGLKLQLDLTIDLDVNRPEIRREVLRALLLQMMYRNESSIPAGTVYLSPPDWLLEGVPAHQSDAAISVSNVLAVSVARRTIPPLDKFLQRRPELLDAPAQSLYRAYSFALVDLLAHAPDGPERLTRFVMDLRFASNDPMADLLAHFPGLFESKAEAETTWETHIARLAAAQSYQLLGGAETERMLEARLRFRISDAGVEKTCELAQFPSFLKHPSAKTALAALAQDLNALALRAHPTYRPVVLEYGKITAMLIRGKTKGIADRLERLTKLRKTIANQMRGIDDYLNWFEATKSRGPSGAFADYMKAAESAARPAHTKRDPISVYLDALEAQFED